MISEDYIRQEYGDTLDKIEIKTGREVSLSIIPEWLTNDDLEYVLKIIEKKGYTFLAACYAVLNKNTEIVSIKSVSVPESLKRQGISERKKRQKIEGLKLGVPNVIKVNRHNTLIDGYGLFVVFEENGELYIPICRSDTEKYNSRVNRNKDTIRFNLIKKYNSRCYICGRKVKFYKSCEKDDNDNVGIATIDHIVPLSKGGSNCFENYALCCLECNGEKSDIVPTDRLIRKRK